MIISIAGPDTYRSREKLHSIQNLGLQKQAKQEIFDFEDIMPPETEDTLLVKFKQSFNTSSLFVEKRLIIIKNIISLNKALYPKIKKTLQTIKDNSEIIVLFYNTNNIPKTHPLNKVLIDIEAKQTQYDYLIESKAISYAQQMSLEQGLDINREGIMYLIDLQKQDHNQSQEKESSKAKKVPFRVDFYKIESMLNQIYNYYGEKQNISKSMLEIIFPTEYNYSIFSLTDYIYSRNYGKYLTALKYIEQSGIEGIAIYGLIISQIKNALIIKLSQEKGKQYHNYTKGHPYVLQMTAQNIRNWNSQDLKKVYLNLIEGDYAIKFQGQNPYAKLRELGTGLITVDNLN
jgi:DNA polymerase-3 subunit delta